MNINTTMLLRSIIWLVVAGAALVLVQMWFGVFADAIFWKIFATLIILGAVVSVVLAIKADMSEEKKRMSPEDLQAMVVSIKADKYSKMGVIIDVKQALRQSKTLRINYSAEDNGK